MYDNLYYWLKVGQLVQQGLGMAWWILSELTEQYITEKWTQNMGGHNKFHGKNPFWVINIGFFSPEILVKLISRIFYC